MLTLRYAMRSLGRTPTFAIIAILALGLGLGLSTTMFAVLDAVPNPYVAYREPDQLFSINWWFGRRSAMSPAELYRYLRDETHSFAAVVPRGWDRVTLERGADLQEVGATRVSRATSRRWV